MIASVSTWRPAKTSRVCAVLVCGLSAIAAAAEPTTRKYVVNAAGERPKPVVAVDNVCAWPNLTLLPDGAVVATIHNRPSHLKEPADIECWASEDGGWTWAKRGTPAPRDTDRAARGNVAAGLAKNGDLVVMVSGFSAPGPKIRGDILPPMVSRSADGGRTWTRDIDAFRVKWLEIGRSKAKQYNIPFGDIIQGSDGALRVGLYSGRVGLTAVYRSDDDGRTWTHRQTLTGPNQEPGHFSRLKDGRVLLSYGNRVKPKGIDVRFSDDDGASWSEPWRVADFQDDGGYPSSVQLPDGRVLTAYYARRVEGHDRYHMGAVVWDPTIAPGR